MNRGVEADKELFANLDRTIRREAEIAEELEAWVQAHNGEQPPERYALCRRVETISYLREGE